MEEKETESVGLRLLKTGQKGIIHAIFSRMGLIVLLLLVQIMLLFSVFYWFEEFLPHILGGTVIFTVTMVGVLLNSSTDPTAKNTWLIVMAVMPVFGALLYLYTQSNVGHRALKKRLAQLIEQTKDSIPQEEQTQVNFEQEEPGAAALAR